MSKLARMRKLTREEGGQISSSSDPDIKAEITKAVIDLRGVKVCDEVIDLAHYFNAVLWGVARLPDPYRTEVVKVFARDLERWRNEEPMCNAASLLAGLKQALVDVKAVRVADVPLRDVDCLDKKPAGKRTRKPSGRA